MSPGKKPQPPALSGFIPPHGGYRELLSFQKAEIIYDFTHRFCERFLQRGDRTNGDQTHERGAGQPRRAARRLPRFPAGAPGSDLAKGFKGGALRAALGSKSNTSYESYRTYMETRSPEVLANIALCLIHQANYLLDQQLRQLEKAFLAEGGLRERMTRARLEARKRQE
jgi:four helix bundle suffix protein